MTFIGVTFIHCHYVKHGLDCGITSEGIGLLLLIFGALFAVVLTWEEEHQR